MARFKKTRNISNLGKPKKPTKKSQMLTATAVVGAVLLAFGLIYAYTAFVPKMAEEKALKLLASSAEKDRIEGMWKIARHHLVQHTGDLCNVLRNDPSANVRKAAPACIARLRDDRAVPALVYALGDNNDEVAKAAMQALQQRYGQNFRWSTIIDWWGKHKSKFNSVVKLPDGPPVVATMNDMLADDKDYVRLAAVRRLAKLEHPAIKPLLQPMIDDPSEVVRKAAQQALDALQPAAEKAQ